MSIEELQKAAAGEPEVRDEKLKKILEKEQKGFRNLKGFWRWTCNILMISMVLIYFYSSGISPLSAQMHRGVYVLLTYALVFIMYPGGSVWFRPFLCMIMGFAVAVTGSAILLYEGIAGFDARLGMVKDLLADEGFVAAMGAMGSLWGVLAAGILLTAGLYEANLWSARRFPNSPGLTDILFFLSASAVVLYWIAEFEALNYRMGSETVLDFYVSFLGIIISLEVARRVLGWSFTLIGIAFILFCLYGPYMPDAFAHRGFRLERIVNALYLTQDGVFGVMADVLATYVILFIFFGAFLHKSGAGRFFIDMPLSIAGRSAGGPAKVAVMASSLFGSISGSAIANTVATGAFTIPMMKRAGFRPHVAGAIEPSASIGGMFMPPVMGAGGFLMAELTGIPYVSIMLISIFPAFLYFLAVLTMVHFEAKKFGIHGLTDLPKPWDIFKKQWYRTLPLLIIIVLMLRGFSPGFSAFWATLGCILVSWGDKETRMGPKEIFEAIITGARNTLIIGATVGVIGIIVGSISLTGIGLKFSDIIITLAGGNLVIALLLIGLASLVLGMGVPVTAAYLIVAVLAVPALGEMGIMIIAAHQIVYWFSQDSNITPPVCVAAYAGAAIAGSDPWKTGWTAFKFAKMLYVMPFLFAFTPEILIKNWDMLPPQPYPLKDVAFSFFSATAGTLAFSALTMGYLVRRTTIFEWIFFAVATFLCFTPTVITDTTGILMVAMLWWWQKRKNRLEQVGEKR